MSIFNKTSRAFALISMLLVAACTVNPATGQKEFTPFMSPSQEAAIGAQEAPKLVAEFGGEYNDPVLAAYVERVGDSLAEVSEMPDTDFSFTVLNSPIVNAFALPGGYVNISRGILAYFNDEAEMAGVLGHEIGHVTARHAANRYNRSIFAGLGAAAVGIFTGNSDLANLVSQGSQLYLLSYSRGQESQSDGLGLRYLVYEGYDPEGSVRMLEALQAAAALDAKILGQEKAQQTPEWARTHPLTSTRIAEQTAAVQNLDPPPTSANRNRDRFLDAIDGMLYGDDPAQGVIRGNDFLHPVLKFGFTAPNDFAMRNSATAVVGQGPNAQFLFTGGQVQSGASNRSILDQAWAGLFDGQPPSGLGSIQNLSTGGMDGITGASTVQGQSGNINVRLVLWRYNQTTAYYFVLITPSGAGQQVTGALQTMTRSFRKISDQEANAIRPWRLRVVTVQSGDTVSGLASRMPMARYREDIFRVLNGLGPSEGLRAGERVKIVLEE